MQLLNAIGNFFSWLIRTMTKNPTASLLVIAAIFCLLFLQQCQHTRDLKRDIKAKEEQLKQEQKRTANNLKALTDTIKYLRGDSVYTKRILAAKQGEIDNLDKELASVAKNIKTITKEKEIPKFIYITTINSKVSTSDVETKVDHSGDSISVGIQTANPLFNLHTQTWFQLLPDSTKKEISLKLVDKYGIGKPSHLDYNLNFKLQLAQTELKDGSKRIYIKPVDLNGNAIDPNLLGVTDVKGVDFIDVASFPQPKPQVRKPKIVMSLGPQLGVTVQSSKVKPYLGFGVSVGLNLFR